MESQEQCYGEHRMLTIINLVRVLCSVEGHSLLEGYFVFVNIHMYVHGLVTLDQYVNVGTG